MNRSRLWLLARIRSIWLRCIWLIGTNAAASGPRWRVFWHVGVSACWWSARALLVLRLRGWVPTVSAATRAHFLLCFPIDGRCSTCQRRQATDPKHARRSAIRSGNADALARLESLDHVLNQQNRRAGPLPRPASHTSVPSGGPVEKEWKKGRWSGKVPAPSEKRSGGGPK